MIVAFAGHRPDKLGGYKPNGVADWVKAELRCQLKGLRQRHADLTAISGMALGFDTWAAEDCVELEIPFTAAVPFVGQEKSWRDGRVRAHYHELLAKAAEVVVVSSGGYTPKKMQVRNEWMVDHCDLLIAAWDGSSGGTSNCWRYAMMSLKDIIRIDPLKRTVRTDVRQLQPADSSAQLTFPRR